MWSGSLNLPHERPFAEFIEGLGPGQVVGRQVLASPCHGEIQVGLRIQQGLLEVEIVRARKLLKKALYASPPCKGHCHTFSLIIDERVYVCLFS